MSFTTPPNDALFGQSWHLLNTGQGGGTAGMDIRASSAWQHYIGRNILVAVLDDGVEASHPDLAANMWTRPGSITLVDAGNANLVTGLPVTPGLNSVGDNHGTSAAGVIGAVGNNGLGGVGVAPGVQLVSYRILGAGNANTADGFQQALNDGAQVLNNSWGNDAAFNHPGTAALTAIANLATQGRGGLGSIVVFANGNERSSQASGQDLTGTEGALDATTANRFTISVAAVENTGIVTDYSTRGSNLLVAAPGGQGDGRLANGNGITTVDRVGPTNGYNDQASPEGDYTGFNGTSAAAPVVAGVAALILEANAGLGYRDVQEILTYTARQIDVAAGTGGNTTFNRSPWVGTHAGNANGGGLNFSIDYGFGLVDAGAAVRLAETWTAARSEANLITTTATAAGTGQITAGGVATAQSFTTTFNLTQPGAAHAGLRINRIELDLGITAPRAHDLTITLQSPGGTLITMARTPGNAFTNPGTGYDINQPTAWPTGGFTLNTPGFWGEDAVGTWTLNITASANAADASSLDAATLRIFGDTANGADLRNMMVFTDDYARLAGLEAGRVTLGAGKTALNAAPLSTAVTIDLRALDGGAQGTTIAGQAVTLAGTTLTDAYGGAGGDMLIGRSGANLLSGGWGNDTLLGGAGNDTLQGGFDDDILDGGVGADSMAGGQGHDQYVVDDAADLATEAASQGTDTAWVATNGWTLGANIEILRLFGAGTQVTGSAGNDIIVANAAAASSIHAGDGHDELWGGGFAHTLNGAAGDDVIRGQDGAVSMIGGTGHDQYVVGHINATITESPGEGTDTAWIAVNNWTNFAHVEIVRMAAPGVVRLTGADTGEDLVANQGEASRIDARGGNDVLWGSGFADTLNGEAGDDIMRGQGGADVMAGGEGNDQYVVFNSGATITEAADAGTDIVYFAGTGTFFIGENVEEARLVADGTGLGANALANLLVGNSSGLASLIDGGAGHDTIWGTAAADTLIGGAGNDIIYSQGGADRILYNATGWGYDQVAGFTAGQAKIQFSAGSGVTQFGQLALNSAGGNTQVEFGGFAILVFGLASMTESDFIFG